MKRLSLTCQTPEENLACDEALLHFCDLNQDTEVLRFWGSPQPVVVLGYSNKIKEHVYVNQCQQDRVPVLRRISGGGTVLHAPGCLNFSLLLQPTSRPELKTITSSNCAILRKNCKALAPLVQKSLSIEGHTDLCMGNYKIAGHAQRRGKKALLFHGTFLLTMNLSLIGKYLPIPNLQPAYRQGRPHQDFLQNLLVKEDSVRNALAAQWEARDVFSHSLETEIKKLAREKYAQEAWNHKF